jgi:hypothetical protein
MARSYGHIMSAIWNDSEFRSLCAAPQRAYLMLVTQSEITSAGTLALTLKRWAGYAADTTSDALSDALSRLEEMRFIAYDNDTEELVVRSFVKWDGGATNEKRRPAITAAANAVVSPKIRAVLKIELDKLGVPHSITDSPSDRHPDTPRVVVTEVGKNPQPTTSNTNPQPATLVPAAERRRATRIPEPFIPSMDDIEWARAKRISDNAQRLQTERFIYFWKGKSGKDGTKLDWSATWRGWLLREYPEGSPDKVTTGTQSAKAMGWMDMPTPAGQPTIEGRTA